MATVLGPRSWVFWWAGLTATVFLQTWLRGIADFFRDKGIFNNNIPPFNITSGLNGLIDNAAEYIRTTVKFNPNSAIVSVGPIAIQNWMIALLLGLIILLLAGVLYVRALGTSGLLDDLIALIVLYFVIRIEAHLIAIARFTALSGAAQSLLANPAISFVILFLLLVILTFIGEGFRNAQSFWRGVIEGIIVAILLFPQQASSAVAAGIDGLAFFGKLLQTQTTLGVVWGVIGMFLALQHLYRPGGAGGSPRRASH